MSRRSYLSVNEIAVRIRNGNLLPVRGLGGGDRGFDSPSSHDAVNSLLMSSQILESIDWQQFHNFLLQRMTAKTAEDRMQYAK